MTGTGTLRCCESYNTMALCTLPVLVHYVVVANMCRPIGAGCGEGSPTVQRHMCASTGAPAGMCSGCRIGKYIGNQLNMGSPAVVAAEAQTKPEEVQVVEKSTIICILFSNQTLKTGGAFKLGSSLLYPFQQSNFETGGAFKLGSSLHRPTWRSTCPTRTSALGVGVVHRGIRGFSGT